LRPFAGKLDIAWRQFRAVADKLREADSQTALANATEMLGAFGYIVVAWLWLDQASVALRAGGTSAGQPLAAAKLAACAFFFDVELPRAECSLATIAGMSTAVADIPAAIFQ
jgi:hypothetical protein